MKKVNITTLTLQTIFPAVICSVLLLSSAAEAATSKNGATSSEAEQKTFVLFPFTGIATDDGVSEASTIVFKNIMTDKGFSIEMWDGYVERSVEIESETPAQDETNPESSTGDEQVESNIQAQNVASKTELRAVALPPKQLRKEDKLDVMKKNNCDGYIEGSLTKLGSRITVSISLIDETGKIIVSKTMTAANNEDIHLALNRISDAIKQNQSTQQTQNLDNLTNFEANNAPNRQRVHNYNGFSIAGGPLMSKNLNYGIVQAGYDGQWEIKNLRAGLNISVILASEGGRSGVSAGLSAAGFLNKRGISPYLGGGVSVSLADRLIDDNSVDSLYGDTEESWFGFEAYPLFGVEFLRNSKMRMHVEIKYSFILDSVGNFGHCPTLGMGMSFQ